MVCTERYVREINDEDRLFFLRSSRSFLVSQHFYIGTNILWNYNEFLTAFQELGDDIAVHTVSFGPIFHA